MNTRIKLVRENKNLSMRAFAERIGVSSGAVAALESGRNNPSEQTIRAICSEFKVRRQWLEEGIGLPEQPADEDDEIVDAVLAGEDEFIKAVIRGIAKTPGGWEKMREVFTSIQAELDKNKNEQP
ncbi:MAG: helix-turn-helix transcriptional regulator [Clostridia bacterium]|nr:helix-turn-helix transcriptional regulator [Clostridia bacterium]